MSLTAAQKREYTAMKVAEAIENESNETIKGQMSSPEYMTNWVVDHSSDYEDESAVMAYCAARTKVLTQRQIDAATTYLEAQGYTVTAP